MTLGIQTRMRYCIRYMNASETQWVACGKCRWSPTGEKEVIEEEGSCPQIGVKRGRGTRWIGMKMARDLCLRVSVRRTKRVRIAEPVVKFSNTNTLENLEKGFFW